MRTVCERKLRIYVSSLFKRSAGFKCNESGSLTILGLFIFVMILFVAGMAVDLMRFETRRVAMQNTLDSAVLAASSLSQNKEAEALVIDHFEKAGFSKDEIVVSSNDNLVNGVDLVGRTVSAKSIVAVETIFMGFLGIDTLRGGADGTARETVQNVEISLIVDISGSMGENNRLTNLKVAAKDFVDVVFANEPPGTTTSISIVPYNATVVVGDDLLSRLNADGSVALINPVPSYTGALAAFRTEHNDSTCVRFDDSEFDTRAIGPTTPLSRVSHFDEGENSFATPPMSNRWCNDNRAGIMVHSTDAGALKDKIDSLTSGGWTGIDNGMKWGVALLDPAFSPVIGGMVDDGLLPKDVQGRPAQYNREETMKIIVLMTDGANTIQKDLKDEFKSGPSRVWFAKSLTEGFHTDFNRDRTNFDGYVVLMPNNTADKQWYVPGSPTTTSDDVYISSGSLPGDALQLDYHELHRRFAEEDIARFFFEHSDSNAYDSHLDAAYETESYASIDSRLQDICDVANKDQDIRVFAIGFEAPTEGLNAMRNCASAIGNYYDVDGTEISDAFRSIAGQIAMLRLTE